MIKSIDEIRIAYENCDCVSCKDCPVGHVVDLIPPEYNDNERVRGSVCDLITHMNEYYVKRIKQLLH